MLAVTSEHSFDYATRRQYEEELERRATAGSLSAAAHDRLFAWNEANFKTLAASGLPADPDKISKEDARRCMWIIYHPDATKRTEFIAAGLASTDPSTRSLTLLLLRWELHVHGVPATLPQSWHQPFVNILKADAHEAYDALLFCQLPVPPDILDLLFARAADPRRRNRGLDLLALERLAKRGQLSADVAVPRLTAMLQEPSPHHMVFSVLGALGPAASDAVPAIRRRLDTPPHDFFARRALAEIEGTPLQPRQPPDLKAPTPPHTGR